MHTFWLVVDKLWTPSFLFTFAPVSGIVCACQSHLNQRSESAHARTVFSIGPRVRVERRLLLVADKKVALASRRSFHAPEASAAHNARGGSGAQVWTLASCYLSVGKISRNGHSPCCIGGGIKISGTQGDTTQPASSSSVPRAPIPHTRTHPGVR